MPIAEFIINMFIMVDQYCPTISNSDRYINQSRSSKSQFLLSIVPILYVDEEAYARYKAQY